MLIQPSPCSRAAFLSILITKWIGADGLKKVINLVNEGITYMKLTEYERISDILEKARKFDELFEFLE